jgi:exopolysaccharide production protein ExoQ
MGSAAGSTTGSAADPAGGFATGSPMGSATGAATGPPTGLADGSATTSPPPPAPVHPRRRALGGVGFGILRGGEALFVIVAIFLLAGAAVPLLLRESAEVAVDLNEGHPLLRNLYFLIYAVMLVFAVLRWKSFLRVVARDPLVVALVGVALLSVTWSIAPDITLRRGVALGLTTAFGWYLAARYSLRDVLRLVTYGLGATLVASVVFALWYPELGISAGATDGAWQGAFLHKNALGKYAALSALLFILLWRTGRRSPSIPVAGLVLSLGLLALSESQTGIIAFATLLALLPVMGVMRWRVRRGAPVIAGAVLIAGCMALFVSSNLELALAAIGRETTLTGRTALWAAVVETGARQPVLGTGYSAFWIPENPEAWSVRDLAGWGADAAHNGFLDLWLELGAVGLALFLLAALLAVRAALRLLRSNPAPEAAWPLLVLAFIFLTNLSEGGILRQNNLVWVLYVAAAAAAFRASREIPRPWDERRAA